MNTTFLKLLRMNGRFALLSCAIITCCFASPALAVDPVKGEVIQISQMGDLQKTCGQLSREAYSMRDVIFEYEDLQSDAEMQGHGVSAAAGVGSFLIGTVTGGIGFAAAGLIASEAIDSNADEAEALKDVAAQRRSFIMGIFKAKGCYGPIEHVMLDSVDNSERTAMAELKPASGHGTGLPHYND